MKRVRMLTDWNVEGLVYRCDQAVEFPERIAKELVNLGAADAAKEAVAFAVKENGGEVLVHESEAKRSAAAVVQALQAQLEAIEAKFDAEKDAEQRAALGKQGDELFAQLGAAKDKLAALAQE